MEKARIVNGTEWGGNHSVKWIENNQDTFFNGQFVCDWELTEILPTEEQQKFIKLRFKNETWVEEATTNEIYEAKKLLIPIQVKNMKFRLALIKSGIMPSSIDLAIEEMPNGVMKENIFTLWNFADYLERNDSSLNIMAGQFNINEEQLDGLFILSNNL